MVLSQPDIIKAVKQGKIVFNPPLEETQWGEASVDLRLGFTFTRLRKLDNMKVSVATGLGALATAGFWENIVLDEFDEQGERKSYILGPGEFVMATTYEKVTVPPNMIAMVEGRSTYARVGLTMHQTAPWIQPGWTDTTIILEIKNHGPLKIELTPIIDKPCQLTFVKLTSPLPAALLYGSRPTDVYAGQQHAFPAARAARPKPATAKPMRAKKSRARR